MIHYKKKVLNYKVSEEDFELYLNAYLNEDPQPLPFNLIF